MDTYRSRQLEIKETTYAERQEAKKAKEEAAAARAEVEAALAAASSKVVPIKTQKTKVGNSPKSGVKNAAKAVRGG